MTINAPATDTVTLFGLHIFGFGQKGATGVQVNSAGKVQIRRCGVTSFCGTGIVVAPSSGDLHFIRDHGHVAFNAAGNILIAPTGSGGVHAIIEHMLVNHSSGYGIKFDTESTTGTVYGGISSSKISYHTGSAVNAHSGTTNVNVVVDHSVIQFNSRVAGAVYADGPAAGITLNFSEIANTATAREAGWTPLNMKQRSLAIIDWQCRR